ncbi:tetraacyldisaccharide 4'-kinase [Marixanthomonas spongiae]|uniref:Tetraacyldisaccharide 4'-kinase n=1 Tax=Marixanthomonas spongiae TaxID=2174845 RepID=A0A2U0I7B9_9FLAO|nr:tetraacyldisaccharide 4'-kinase [Marixanthomonas spongiae]PVW16997.1 tetraacyldisaccharide 4'-kinase [Marixanthomonas spongiae]
MKTLRTLLFPFAVLYGWVTGFRNYLYDKNILKSKAYNLPIICVGNLSVGGTGKSPMIEFLIETLQDDYKIAVLSRGYKRKTSGYLEVLPSHTAEETGDEPLQFKKKFPKVTVAVCADRRTGIEKLKQKAEVILLDDAFQHRKVTVDTNILLTPFHDLYINDYMLPTGNLREPRSGAERADIIVITKCPDKVPYSKLQEIEFKLPLQEHQKLYFSSIGYDGLIYGKTETLPLEYLTDKHFTLVTGIANPAPLVKFLKDKGCRFEHDSYADHHHFSAEEIEKLKEKELILTTEKDFMRLQHKLDKFALYYLPITTKIKNGQEAFLKETILQRVTARFKA